jgi:Chaperone of endosialidase
MGKNVTISTLPNIGQNYLPKINSSNIFANSLVYDDGSSVLINTTTASAFKLDVNGSIRATSGTLTGALSGTSATFSGNLNLQGAVTRNINFYDSSNTNINAQIQYDQITSNSGQLFFGTNNAGTFATRLTIANTGAATFSGAVGVNGATAVAELQVGKASDVTIAMSNSTSVITGNRGTLAWYNSSNSSVAGIRAVAVTDNVGSDLEFYTRPAAGSLTKVLTLASTGAANFSNDVTVGQATAATNVQVILNGVANKAGRIKFQESGVDKWLIGNGAASENGNFEIYNANGQQALVFNKTTSAATFSSSVTANGDFSSGTSYNSTSAYKINADSNWSFGAYNSGSTYLMQVQFSGDGTNNRGFRIFNNNGNTELLRVTSGGNVGIMTSSPSTYVDGSSGLAVAGSARGSIAIVGTSTTADESLGRLSFTNTNTTNTASRLVIIDGVRGADNNSGYLTFSTANSGNPTERMRITSGGNVGIGTTSPASLLQVNGQFRQVYSKAFASNPLDTDGYSGHIIVNSNNTNGDLAGIGLYTGSAYTAAAGLFALRESASAASMVFYTGSNLASERMRITSGGSVCINSTSPLNGNAKLNINGELWMGNVTAGAGNSTLKYNSNTGLVTFDASARIFKKDIIDLEYGLYSVLKMQPKKYKWKSNDCEDLGFIADEMYQIIPEIVALADNKVNNNGLNYGEPLSINYDRLAPILVKAIQELKSEIDTLKK